MSQLIGRNLALAAALGLGGCATTQFNSTWKAPDAQPVNLAGQKVAAVVLSKKEGVRRGAEDALAREITLQGAQGIAAYTIVPGDVRDKDQAKALFEKAGIQGVVTMKAVGKDKELSYSPGMWTGPGYGSFWGGGYWGYGWGGVYDPGYLTTNTIVTVETLVYSLKQDKLIWAGQSQTTNPEKADAFIKELTGAAAKEMRKAGLLTGGASR